MISAYEIYYKILRAKQYKKEKILKQRFFRYIIDDLGNKKIKCVRGHQIYAYIKRKMDESNLFEKMRVDDEMKEYIYFTEKELIEKNDNITNNYVNIDKRKISIDKRSVKFNGFEQLLKKVNPEPRFIDTKQLKRIN